jgi:hypothetical protein
MDSYILQSILNCYQTPTLSIRAQVSKKKRVQRQRINRPIRFIYSYHPDLSAKDIKRYNKSRFFVEYTIDMRSYPNAKQDSLRFRNDKPFNLLFASISDIGIRTPTYQLETLKLAKFGWSYRLNNRTWDRFEEITELGKQEIKRTIYLHYKNLLADKINS